MKKKIIKINTLVSTYKDILYDLFERFTKKESG